MVDYYVVDIDEEIDQMITWMYETKDKGLKVIIDNTRDKLKASQDDFAFASLHYSYEYVTESE